MATHCEGSNDASMDDAIACRDGASVSEGQIVGAIFDKKEEEEEKQREKERELRMPRLRDTTIDAAAGGAMSNLAFSLLQEQVRSLSTTVFIS